MPSEICHHPTTTTSKRKSDVSMLPITRTTPKKPMSQKVRFFPHVRQRKVPGLTYFSKEMRRTLWVTSEEKEEARTNAVSDGKAEFQRRQKSFHIAQQSRDAVLNEQDLHQDLFSASALIAEYMDYSKKALEIAQLQGRMNALEVRGSSFPAMSQ